MISEWKALPSAQWEQIYKAFLRYVAAAHLDLTGPWKSSLYSTTDYISSWRWDSSVDHACDTVNECEYGPTHGDLDMDQTEWSFDEYWAHSEEHG